MRRGYRAHIEYIVTAKRNLSLRVPFLDESLSLSFFLAHSSTMSAPVTLIPSNDSLIRCLKGILDKHKRPAWERLILKTIDETLEQGGHSVSMGRKWFEDHEGVDFSDVTWDRFRAVGMTVTPTSDNDRVNFSFDI